MRFVDICIYQLTYSLSNDYLPMHNKFLYASFLAAVMLMPVWLFAQKAPSKFGQVDNKDFDLKLCSFDSSAHAMYLFEFGQSYLNYTGKGFQLITHKHARIIVFDAKGVNQANCEFYLYTPVVTIMKAIKNSMLFPTT
jgi:hypothetical protein